MQLITIILGTRPEAIKLAPLIKCFSKIQLIKLRIVVTGQHLEMVDQVFRSFGISYDLNLKIMTKNQTLTYITTKILNDLEKEFQNFYPSLVLVQGDTTTAFAAGLAAFYKKIPVGHVEAGLRTRTIDEPFPEELNRRLISNMASINFAPTEKAVENLIHYKANGLIYKTGNTVIDSVRIISEKKEKSDIHSLYLKNQDIILATIHRRENWGDNLINIANALFQIAENNKNLIIVIPLHPNPKVKDTLKKILRKQKRIILKEPMDYEDLIAHINISKIVITDSGGIQEEAPGLSKPVLILRNNTEREESVKSGNAKIIGTKTETIIKETNLILRDKTEFEKMSKAVNPYGDGYASEKIVDLCLQFLEIKTKNK